MAIQAPSHLEGVDPLGDSHFVLDLSVALLALHSTADVPLVAEVHKVGEVVDLLPWDRLTGVVILDELHELWPVLGADALVAVHARARFGNTCMDASARAGVAVLTCDLQCAGMELVGVGDGLFQIFRALHFTESDLPLKGWDQCVGLQWEQLVLGRVVATWASWNHISDVKGRSFFLGGLVCVALRADQPEGQTGCRECNKAQRREDL